MTQTRVMVVEDEVIVGESIRKNLEKSGYIVTSVASSGEEAVATALADPPDVILMDIKLRGDMDGVAAARKIRAQRDIPIVYLTAYGDEETLKRAQGTEPLGYVLKPFEAREVSIAIEMAVFKHAMSLQLRESEERFRELAELLPEIVYEVDTEGTLTFVNRCAYSMTGYGEDDFRNGVRVIDLFDPADRERLSRNIQDAMRGAVDINNEYTVLRHDGTGFPVIAHSAPIIHAGKVVGLRGVLTNISELRRAEKLRHDIEAKMRQAQKLESLGVMAGGIAHDFNNLLMSVLGNTDLLLMDLPEPSPMRECVEEINEAARRAAALTSQMLAYSGSGRLVVETKDLSELVRQMKPLILASVPKDIEVSYSLAEDLPETEMDSGQIHQVVLNLITNAAEAIEDLQQEAKAESRTKQIWVRTGLMDASRDYLAKTYIDDDLTPGTYLFLEVEDTGCGIEDEALARLFDPFFTTKFTGRGMGLPAVLGIVRGHKGALRVSSSPGAGTTVRVLLPRLPNDEIHTDSDSANHVPWQGQGTILLVDDEKSVRAVGTRMLQRMGFNVLTAIDGHEALDIFRQHTSALFCVILDLTMPRMSGEAAFREFKRICPQVPVIISSGYSQEAVASRFQGADVAGFIQKPYRMAALAEQLEALAG